MSKLDQVKEMSATQELPPGIRLMDLEILQSKMERLSQEFQDWEGRNADTLKAYRELQMGVRNSVISVREITKEVKEYPAETSAKISERLEKCARQCEESARQAQHFFNSARGFIGKSGQSELLKMLAAAFLASTSTAIALLLILK